VGALVGLLSIVRRLVGDFVGGITGSAVIGVKDGAKVGLIGEDVVGSFTGEKGATVPGGVNVTGAVVTMGDTELGVMGITFIHVQIDNSNGEISLQSSGVIFPSFPAISNVPQGMFEYMGDGGVNTAFGLPTTIPIPQTLQGGLLCAWLITIDDIVRR
jgi:hypothetical protein